MEESVNMLEIERLGSDASQINSEIGATRRRRRSLRSISGNTRKNIITELPSRQNSALCVNTHLDAASVGLETADDVESEATRIVEQIHHIDHDETSKSVKDRMENLREMTQSLTLKRSVRSKLLRTLERRAGKSEVSLAKRVGRFLNVATIHVSDSWKELMVTIEPWYKKLKNIEGHFGSGVATYFKFLRSLFFINLLVFFVSFVFVVVPQIILVSQRNETVPKRAFAFGNLFTGEGYLSDSLLFYGYYTNETLAFGGVEYNMPSAYFYTALVSYLLVFILLSASMAVSFRKNYIESAGSVKNVYANKVFCAWDFGIATQQAANLKAKSIHTEFKELLEERSLDKQKLSCWQHVHLWGMRISLNVLLLSCLCVTGYYAWLYLSSHVTPVDTPTAMMISLTVTIVIHIGPMVMIWLLRYEEYESPRTATYVTLFRTFFLDTFLIGILVAYRLHMAKNDGVCWETALGQEIYRLVLLDFLVGLVGTSLAQFVRRLIHLKLWPGIGYPEVDVARNTINLLYNEALFFVGLYFSPLLSLVIIFKLWLTFYVRYWGATRDCKPSERMWRAQQTQTVFLTTAFIAFILVIILYGYILSSVATSTCGPFRGRKITYQVVLDSLNREESSLALHIILYVRKPGVVAVILIAMFLSVYYLRAVGKARARVVRILHDVLHLQAKDKEYLLQMLSRISRPTSPPAHHLGVKFRSEQELSTSQHIDSQSNVSDIRRSRSLFDVAGDPVNSNNFLEAERETHDTTPRLKFNPIFTESFPLSDTKSDQTNDRQVTIRDNKEPEEILLETVVKYTPNPDDRVPSRIGFPELSHSARRRI